MADTKNDVDHPSHYQGKVEVIEGIEAWGLHRNFYRGNAVKYIARAGKKNPDREIEDLEKARWYLNREIETLRATKENREPVRPNDMNPRSSNSSPSKALSSPSENASPVISQPETSASSSAILAAVATDRTCGDCHSEAEIKTGVARFGSHLPKFPQAFPCPCPCHLR